MTERRGSARNIVFWHMRCQREGCGHPRVRHLDNPKPQCCAVVYDMQPDADRGFRAGVGRCECTQFQEVKE